MIRTLQHHCNILSGELMNFFYTDGGYQKRVCGLNNLILNSLYITLKKMVKDTLKILRCKYCKIFTVRLAILQVWGKPTFWTRRELE